MFIYIFLFLLPLIMIGFGSQFANKPPKKINMTYGYRTTRSMKNTETWAFAHEHFGKTWRLVGVILTGINVVTLILLRVLPLKSGFEVAFYAVVALIGVQLVALIVSIFPTERALKKNFDKDGNRIKEKKA